MTILALILRWLGVAEAVATDTLGVIAHHTGTTVPATALQIVKQPTAKQ